MKKVILFIFISFFVVSCQDDGIVVDKSCNNPNKVLTKAGIHEEILCFLMVEKKNKERYISSSHAGIEVKDCEIGSYFPYCLNK